MYQNILFDLDGTLTDPGVGITNSVMYALEKYNIKIEERSTLYKFIGPPLKDSFQNFYGFTEEQSIEAVAYYREYYKEKGIFQNRVYDGIEELLEKLKRKNKKIYLATSKPEKFAKQILEHFELLQYFDFVAGATLDGVRSSKGDVIQHVLQEAQIKNLSETLMIGDREYDILGAKDYKIDAMGVLFGYGNYEELNKAGAKYIAKTVEDIWNILKDQ